MSNILDCQYFFISPGVLYISKPFSLTGGDAGDTIHWRDLIVSKQDKREKKIRQNPKNVSLEDFERLINTYGYIKGSGSHLKARIGAFTLPYKRENPIKPIYIKELLKLIDSL